MSAESGARRAYELEFRVLVDGLTEEALGSIASGIDQAIADATGNGDVSVMARTIDSPRPGRWEYVY